MTAPVYVIGDIHGQMERLAGLLYASGIVSNKGAWLGGGATLIFVGDFFDRGPYAIEALDFVMALQAEAATAGGFVEALLGNHDLLALCSLTFRGRYIGIQQANGGSTQTLNRVMPEHVRWLTERPALVRAGDRLIVHADTTRYLRYGRTVAQINHRVRSMLAVPDEAAWDEFLSDISDRHGFDPTTEHGTARLSSFLAVFGARGLVHGHTPIPYVTGQSPDEISGPYVYADGRAVNVDGGMYMGGRGFIYRVEPSPDSEPAASRPGFTAG